MITVRELKPHRFTLKVWHAGERGVVQPALRHALLPSTPQG